MGAWGLFGPPDAVEIIPGLHMGAAPSRRGARLIARSGVSYAVDLRDDAVKTPSPWPDTVQVFTCPLVEYQAPDVATLRGITGQIASLIESGEIVYVHCRAGVQRAPMVACAVLVHMGWPLADAYRLVSSRRGVTAMSPEQLTVLRELVAELAAAAGGDSHNPISETTVSRGRSTLSPATPAGREPSPG